MYHIILKIFVLLFYSIGSYLLAFNFKNDMILIPKGIYSPLFKTNNDEITIKVNSFFIDKYPVTNIEFKMFLDSNKNWSKENIKDIFVNKNYLNHWDEFNFDNISDYPVVNVSWFTANAYCNYFGKRLPTLDEWEYVSSASEISIVGKSDSNYIQTILNWYMSNNFDYFIHRKSMKKNYWNIFGIHGVIWEWVEDFNSVILLNTDTEGGGLEEVLYCGATAMNVINASDYVAFLRYAFRNNLEANYTITSLGFRCAKDIE